MCPAPETPEKVICIMPTSKEPRNANFMGCTTKEHKCAIHIMPTPKYTTYSIY